MVNSIDKSIELDFAEFTSTLISETLNAIMTSALTQEKQASQFEQQLSLSPEEYAKENLTQEHVEAEIRQLFPSTNGKSSVYIGAPYALNNEGIEEFPPINKKIGYTITSEDLSTVRLSDQTIQTVINQTGYEHICAATRLTLATQQLLVIKQIIKRGIPRIYINDGHIKTKLMLRLENQTPIDITNSDEEDRKKVSILNKLRKLVVQPVNANKPEFLTLNADILSEIEITFKVIIP